MVIKYGCVQFYKNTKADFGWQKFQNFFRAKIGRFAQNSISMKFFHHFKLFALLFLLVPAALFSQKTFPVAAPSDAREGCYAFTNASIYIDYKTMREDATLVIRKGKIEACGSGVRVPADAVLVDCTGKTIYPAFIDCYAEGFGLPEMKTAPPAPGDRFNNLPTASRQGAFSWNDALRTDFNAAENYHFDEKNAQNWLKMGFATLQTFRADGISRGTGALVSLSNRPDHESFLAAKSAHFLSFRKGASKQNYPSSLMGCIALIRQTFLDGKWYAVGQTEEKNLSLEAWNTAQSLPQIFEAGDKLDILRAAKIGQEFGVKFLVKTNGDEYQRLAEVKSSGFPLIVGVNFPEGYDVRDPFEAMDISLKDLKHWELAPTNLARLEAAGVPFALTASGLKDKSKFMENLRKAIENGLSEQTALQALTYHPAVFLNVFEKIGSLETGKSANFIITDGNVFQKETRIFQTWSGGQPNVVADEADDFPKNLYGEYLLTLDGDQLFNFSIKNKKNQPEAEILRADSSKTKVNIAVKNGLFTLSFQMDTSRAEQFLLAGEAVGTRISGRGTNPAGRWMDWSATQKSPAEPTKPTKQNPIKSPENGEVFYPFTAFGWKEKPVAATFLIQNATVWTNEKDGILPETDVLIAAGKIEKIGKKLAAPPGATVVNGTGFHLTPGIIDEHSHICITRGGNEGTQESSAEVRIGDVLDSEDVDIYRQLAGGVTSSQIMHGSANPIGGQTQLIKLRWGASPEELKFAGWPGFIKFALGENVKQSNWEIPVRTRYPQTRMGVEQVYTDYFTRAAEYSKLKKSGKNYRKDLELEALSEILESKRFITCHSYVQSEITMLMRVAEQFGFRVNTFTHILEGYKVADKMAKHGVAASTFSDWWAYKFEVAQAIPFNAKIMADQGVLVAINSDDAEMARRLNQEAAKSILYGGMKEEDALKMVTLNPAKILHVEDKVGSLKVGKDADLVLWNANPLSIYASASKTWVDGTLFFDREKDMEIREAVQAERARIIQKMIAAKKGGEGGEKPSRARPKYHCDDVDDEG